MINKNRIQLVFLTILLGTCLGTFPSLAAMRTGSAAGAGSSASSVNGTGTTAPGAAQSAGASAMAAKGSAGKYDAAHLAPSGAEVLVVVASNGESKNATGELYTYVKNASGTWEEKMTAVPAKLGRGGVGKEKEGDQKTPLGTFWMNTPFGIKAAGDGFPAGYLKVTADHYWSGEQNATYNKLCQVRKDGAYTSASEHLIDFGGYYDYALNTGYNPSCEIGKGSALFLHCEVNGQNTGGCIAIPSSDMKKVLTLYQEGRTVIVIRNKGDL